MALKPLILEALKLYPNLNLLRCINGQCLTPVNSDLSPNGEPYPHFSAIVIVDDTVCRQDPNGVQTGTKPLRSPESIVSASY